MNNLIKYLMPAIGLGFAMCSCGGDESHLPPGMSIPVITMGDPVPYEFEKSRTEIPYISDLVLIYGGGHMRKPYHWSQNRLSSYLSYTDKEGKEHWFFDGLLMLEFADYGTDSNNVTFITGYKDASGQYLPSATKEDWQSLIDYFFVENTGIDAMDKQVAAISQRIGAPKHKRQVVISLPEPIQHKNCYNTSSTTVYWGELNGKQLDFSKSQDRLDALKWFIDQIREKFSKGNFKNVELAGFYWTAENSISTSGLLPHISDYVSQLNYLFTWIPYFKSSGFDKWKSYKFHNAYLQPNYFFNESVPVTRLDEAFADADKYDMGMEMEFDGNVLSSLNSKKAYRLRDYMSAFKRHDVWQKRRIAYYQCNTTVRDLQLSRNAEDQKLYHEFCTFVISRPTRRD